MKHWEELLERTLLARGRSAATVKHFLETLADYDILDAYLEDTEVLFDPRDYDEARKELGEQGLPLLAVDRTAWQQLWVQWVSLQDLACAARHLEDGLTVDRAKTVQQIPTHTQQARFGLLRIRSHSAHEIIRRARNIGYSIPD